MRASSRSSTTLHIVVWGKSPPNLSKQTSHSSFQLQQPEFCINPCTHVPYALPPRLLHLMSSRFGWMLNTCLLLHSLWHCFSFSHGPDTPGNRQLSAWERGGYWEMVGGWQLWPRKIKVLGREPQLNSGSPSGLTSRGLCL